VKIRKGKKQIRHIGRICYTINLTLELVLKIGLATLEHKTKNNNGEIEYEYYGFLFI